MGAPVHNSHGRSKGRIRGGRGRGGRGGRGGHPDQKRSHFKISRVEETRDATASSTGDDGSASEDDPTDVVPDEGLESEEDESTLTSSYGQLLQALNTRSQGREQATKRRKLLEDVSEAAGGSVQIHCTEGQAPDDNWLKNDLRDETENDETGSEAEETDHGLCTAVEDEQDDLEPEDLTDPFESHFANPDPTDLRERVTAMKEKKWIVQPARIYQGVKHQYSVPICNGGSAQDAFQIRTFGGLKLKKRLVAAGQQVWTGSPFREQEIASAIFTYKDVLFGVRTLDNTAHLRDLVVLHALNHVFKTRDRVIKNNSKANSEEDGPEIRDQGFTRPKVLFILPTKQACVRFVDSMVEKCQPEQQENKARFLEGFAEGIENPWQEKPRDFQELFGGNDDDMFRIGLKFTRKTIKFFSAFYKSDIILASPLGLRTAIETGGSKEGKKGGDADFLSSIEIVIMDHANALLMQNWQHVEYIFSQLNLLPKDAHGCDFSRVRHWYLDGEARYIRQTIVLTDFITPEINSVSTKFMLNVGGKVRFTPVFFEGAMLGASISLPVSSISQVFIRLDSPAPLADPDVRFSHFTSTILPSLARSKQDKGTLIFTSSYLEFVRLRNHLSTSTTTAALSFGGISEYGSVRDVARARSHFATGRQSLLLYSERAHHFRRYKLRGVKAVVFYSLPENPIFWTEMIASLDPDPSERSSSSASASYFSSSPSPYKARRAVTALFSRWDVLKLERIVGTQRVGKMVNDNAGDTFEFT